MHKDLPLVRAPSRLQDVNCNYLMQFMFPIVPYSADWWRCGQSLFKNIACMLVSSSEIKTLLCRNFRPLLSVTLGSDVAVSSTGI